MIKKWIVVWGLAALMSRGAFASVLTGPILNPANGHIYYLLDQSNWTTAEAEAITLGGHLVTINDQAENDWVFQTFGLFGNVSRHLWLGLNDVAVEGTFVWTDGEPFVYANWSPGEPNNNTDEDYVHMYDPMNASGLGGKWNDTKNTTSAGTAILNGVVETVPEPGAALLVGLGGLGLFALCRRK
jgi:hypothetical protein